jgi:hypothetical protein
MTAYEVSYDLRQPGRNYQPLWDRLKAWNAVRVLESVWIIPEAKSATAVRDDLVQYLDSNDGLLVSGMTGEAAWKNLKGSADKFLLDRFRSAA